MKIYYMTAVRYNANGMPVYMYVRSYKVAMLGGFLPLLAVQHNVYKVAGSSLRHQPLD